MTVGMIMYSFAWIGCILPAKGVGGGAAGLSLVLCHAVEEWLGVSIQIGTMVFIINGILLLIAGFIIGWNFGVKTVYCVVVISLGMNFWQSVLPEGDFLHLERILSVILGGILAGIDVYKRQGRAWSRTKPAGCEKRRRMVRIPKNCTIFVYFAP